MREKTIPSEKIPSPDASKIAHVVCEDPGCNISQALERTEFGRYAFRNALDEATLGGVIHQVPHGRETLLFPDHDDIEQVAPQLAALRDPHTLRLYRLLYQQPEVSDRQILFQYAKNEWGLEEDFLRWRLWRLEQAGLLYAFHGWQDRRHAKYRCIPAHPFVLRHLKQDNWPCYVLTHSVQSPQDG